MRRAAARRAAGTAARCDARRASSSSPATAPRRCSKRCRSRRCGRARLVALLGANGAGKSTRCARWPACCARSAARSCSTTSAIEQLAAHRIVARGLVLVPEGRQVFPELSVLRQPPARRLRAPATSITRPRSKRCSTRFPRLRERLRQRAGLLSGGEQQMLAIARGLMAQAAHPAARRAVARPGAGDDRRTVRRARRTARRRRHHPAGRPDGGAGARRSPTAATCSSPGRIVRDDRAAALAHDPALEAAYLGGAEAAQ